MATLGTEESVEVAIVEKFKQELMYIVWIFASQDKNSGHCGEMAISGCSTVQ